MAVSEAVPPALVQTEPEDPFPPLAGLKKRPNSLSSSVHNGPVAEIPLPPVPAPNPSNGAQREDCREAGDEEDDEEVEEGEIRAAPLAAAAGSKEFTVETPLSAFSIPSIPIFGEFEEAPAPAGEAVPILQSATGFKGAFGSGFEAGSAPEIGWNGALEGVPEAENAVETPIVASEPAAAAPPSAAAAPATGYAPRRRVFYLARIPRSVDHKLLNDIRMAEMQVEAMNKNRDYFRAALQLKRAERSDVIEKLRPVRERERGMREAMQQTRAEMEPFQQALSDFRTTFTSARGPAAICSSEAELDERIGLLRYRMEHESIPLKEEKLILKEIKRLEGTRAQVCQNTISQAELLDRYGPKQDIQDNCRSIGVKLDVIRNEHKQLRAELEVQEREIQESNRAMDELRQLMEKADQAQRMAYTRLRELKRQENASNDGFFQNRRDIQKAKGFVNDKKFELAEEHCNNQVEHIMAMWNDDERFRSTYMKSNERSTLRRLETLDGRSLGPDEEPPLLASDVDTPLEGLHSSLAMEKQHPNAQQASGRPKDSGKVVPKKEPKKEPASSPVNVVNLVKEPEKHTDRDLEPVHRSKSSASSNINGAKVPPPPLSDRQEEQEKKEAKAAELKEKRRQEEKAKAEEAVERKKRRAEKNEAKAKIRAQKEAERREKEREKKARKKVVASAAIGEVSESADNEISALPNTRDSGGSEDLASTQEPSTTRKAPINRKKPVVKPVLKKPKVSKGTLVMPKSKPSYSLWVLVILLVVIVIALLVFVIGFSKYP